MKKCFAALALVALVLAGLPPSGASADDEFFKLAGKRNWLSYADARPVSPYFGIPGELRPGVPFARSWIDASPGRSECFAALYYPDEVVEEGVLQTTGQYENNTMARTNNPDVGNGTKKEIAPFGMQGPRALTDNPSRTECSSEAVSGVGPGQGELLVDTGFAKTRAAFDGDKVVTDEAVSRVLGVSVGAIRIAALETRLKLEYILDAEPVVTYSMTIAGLEADGKPAAGLGDQGLVLAGQQVAGRDLIEQFNTEVAKAGGALKEQAFADFVRLVAPTVEEDADGGVHVTGPALEVGQENTFRKGDGGSHFGLRLGYATVYALLNSLEGLVPDAGDLSLEGPGSPLGSPTDASTGAGAGDASLLASGGTDAGSTNNGLLGLPIGKTAGSISASSGLGSGGYAGGGLDAAATGAGAAEAAPAADESALGNLGSVATPRVRGMASAQLAAAETRRAARNTANGLLGGILLLTGALVWVAGMALVGRKATA
jgi:hypothetical protein